MGTGTCVVYKCSPVNVASTASEVRHLYVGGNFVCHVTRSALGR